MLHRQPPGSSRFGKRGHVELQQGDVPVPPPVSQPAVSATADPIGKALRWSVGAIVAMFLMVAVAFGTGGGSLFGGLIGGLLGAQLARKVMGTPSPTAAAPAATAPHATAPSTNVQRGGFGSTASSGSGFFSGS